MGGWVSGSCASGGRVGEGWARLTPDGGKHLENLFFSLVEGRQTDSNQTFPGHNLGLVPMSRYRPGRSLV